MLVTKGGTQGYYAEKYGVGLAVESCDGLAERMKEYFVSFDFESYENRCNNLLREFVKDYVKFSEVVNHFIDL